jgi:uncharacterized protein
MHQRFVEIPHSLLEAATLDALLEVFVTRQGYDTTSEAAIQDWTAQLKQQLQCGELMILHDIETETTELMTSQQARRFLQALE